APLFPYTTLFRSRIQAIPLAPTRPGASAIKEAGLSSARSTTMPQLDQIPAGVAQARYTPLLRGRAGARPSRERPCSHPGRVLLRQPTPAPLAGAPVPGAKRRRRRTAASGAACGHEDQRAQRRQVQLQGLRLAMTLLGLGVQLATAACA